MKLASTPKDTVHREGTARLYRFRPVHEGRAEAGPPVFLVPSVINRWYVLDLRPGASVAEALVAAGFDVFCLDWGAPEDEDRYLEWETLFRRLGRAWRVAQRLSGQKRMGLLGYCMGATVAGIFAAQHPDEVAAFVNLAGPFDFSKAGFLGEMTDPRWFDAEVVAAAGNISPIQMQSGFTTLRPTQNLAKWMGVIDRWPDAPSMDAFQALESWANDNIAFPAAAYVRYIQDLYQKNELIQGRHWVNGQRVELTAITCPVLTVTADRDNICPVSAASALNDHVGSAVRELLVIPGGHVGAVVGSKAPKLLYPMLARWFGPGSSYPLAVRSPTAQA
ncbi:MAG: alpha/beta fold hydrolase [Myxococcota bacterium]